MAIGSGLLAIARGALQGQDIARQRRDEAEERERERARQEQQDEIARVLAQVQLRQLGVTPDPGVPTPPAPSESPAFQGGSVLSAARGAIGLQRTAQTPSDSGPSPLTTPPDLGVDVPDFDYGTQLEPAPDRVRIGRAFGQELYYTPQESELDRADRLEREERGLLEEQRRGAYDALRRRAPGEYPRYVEGFDYLEELDKVLGDTRTDRSAAASDQRRLSYETAGEQRHLTREQDEEAAETQRALARTRAVNMLNAGASPDRVHQAIDTYPELKGVLAFDDVVELAREIGQTGKDPRTKERRDAWEKRLGAPTTQLQQDILDALAEGQTAETILTDMGAAGVPEAILKSADRYLLLAKSRGAR